MRETGKGAEGVTKIKKQVKNVDAGMKLKIHDGVITTLSQQASQLISPSAIFSLRYVLVLQAVFVVFLNPCNYSNHYDSMCVSIENYIPGV